MKEASQHPTSEAGLRALLQHIAPQEREQVMRQLIDTIAEHGGVRYMRHEEIDWNELHWLRCA